MSDITINHCNQCPNQCPETDLKCGRGKKYFAQGSGQAPQEGQEQENRTWGEHRNHHGGGHGEHHEGGHEHRGHHENRHEHRDHHGDGVGHGRDDLYGRMRACGHYLFHHSGSGAGQGKILAILSRRGRMTQKELQEVLQIQPGSMSEILAKLEEKGLIVRNKDDEDKRRSVLTLTEAGRESVKEIQENEKPLFGALDENEQEELKKLLGKLLESWK